MWMNGKERWKAADHAYSAVARSLEADFLSYGDSLGRKMLLGRRYHSRVICTGDEPGEYWR